MNHRQYRYILGVPRQNRPVNNFELYDSRHIGKLTRIPGTRCTRVVIPDDMELIRDDVYCHSTTYDSRTLKELSCDIMVTAYYGKLIYAGDKAKSVKAAAKHRTKWREMLWRNDPKAFDPDKRWGLE